VGKTHRSILWFISLLTILVINAASCQTINPLVTSTTTAFRTATPTWWIAITPEPTATPLFRVSRIHGRYGQNLVLYVGDTFILDNLEDSISPVTFDQSVLQRISDPADDFTKPIELRAIKPGLTEISTIVVPPCPHAPVGCQPPDTVILVVVDVIESNQ
jgi:hypothetical protein